MLQISAFSSFYLTSLSHFLPHFHSCLFFLCFLLSLTAGPPLSLSLSLSLSHTHTHRLSFFLVRSSLHIFPQPYLPLFHLPNFLHHILISSILRVTQSATFSPYHIYALYQYCQATPTTHSSHFKP